MDEFSIRGLTPTRPTATATRRTWTILLVFAGALLAWKQLYFGELLPNSYVAKSGGGWQAVRGGLADTADLARWLGPIAAGSIVGIFVVLRARSRYRALLGACVTTSVIAAACLRVGGDYQLYFRYLVPIVPMLLALAATGIVWILEALFVGRNRLRVAAYVCAIACCSLVLGRGSLRESLSPRQMSGESDFEPMARLLATLATPEQTIGAIAVGRIGYFCDAKIFDLLGINDREIARAPIVGAGERPWLSGHMRGSAEITLRRAPEYLVLAARPSPAAQVAPPEGTLRAYPFTRGLVADARFAASYEPQACRLSDGSWLSFYRRRDIPKAACDAP